MTELALQTENYVHFTIPGLYMTTDIFISTIPLHFHKNLSQVCNRIILIVKWFLLSILSWFSWPYREAGSWGILERELSYQFRAAYFGEENLPDSNTPEKDLRIPAPHFSFQENGFLSAPGSEQPSAPTHSETVQLCRWELSFISSLAEVRPGWKEIFPQGQKCGCPISVWNSSLLHPDSLTPARPGSK